MFRIRFSFYSRECARTGSDMVTTVAGVYDILFGMRRCRINLPNRCYHLISRVAHRAYFLDEDECSDPGHPNSPQQKYALTKDGKRRIERVAPL